MTPGPFAPLYTKRLVLRPFQPYDLDAFVAYRADPSVAKYQSWEQYSTADGEQFLKEMDGKPFGRDDDPYQIGVADRASNALLGDCMVRVKDQGRQAELGCTVAVAYQGNGIAREAMVELLRFVFVENGLHRLTATTDALNVPATALLERLGFRREGHYLKNIFFKGAWGDEFSYAMLHSEWLESRLQK